MTVAVINDTLIEPNEQFFVVLDQVTGASLGQATGTVTIIDNDIPIPNATTGLTAKQSRAVLGGVELSWTAATVPLQDWPLTGYEYRVSTNGGTTFGAWATTGAGATTSFIHACGAGRHLHLPGARPATRRAPVTATGQATATGLSDTASPVLSVQSPTHRGNLDTPEPHDASPVTRASTAATPARSR